MKDIKRSWTESKALTFMHGNEHTMVPEILYFLIFAFCGAIGAGIYTGAHTHNGWLVLLSVVMTLAMVWGYPSLRLLSPLSKMNNDSLHPNGTIHGYSCRGGGRGYYDRVTCPGKHCEGSRNLIREVRALPSADRAQFPHDLIAALSRDIEGQRRYEINTEIRTTLNEIKARNEQRELARKRAVPTDHIVDSLKEARESFKIETDTIKELL